MKFNYQARTKEGKIETGTIEASSKESAALLLQKYNVFITSLEEQEVKSPFFVGIHLEKRISKKDLIIFFRQLSIMLESRVPIVQSLSSLSFQTRKVNFKKVIAKISSLVESGVPLSDALANYPQIFGNFYIALVKSGELSGKISDSLSQIADHLEREDDVVAQVRQAMIYPLFVVCVLFVVVSIIIVEVMPQITNLIKESHSNLSFSSSLTLNIYGFLGSYWWVLVSAIILAILVIGYYISTKSGNRRYHKMSLQIPFLGDLLKKIFLARFCGNVATLLSSGVSIGKALKITEDTVNNTAYKEAISYIGRGVLEGERISAVMENYEEYFPPFVVLMIKVGEETGKLDKTLMEIVSFYEKETKRSVDLFSTLLEPIMIIILGIIVGILAISVLSLLYGVIGTI